jgi:hypothetical protein
LRRRPIMNSPTQPMVAKSIMMVAVQVIARKVLPRVAPNPMPAPNSATALVALKMTTVAMAEPRPIQINPICNLVREGSGCNGIGDTDRYYSKICQGNPMLIS